MKIFSNSCHQKAKRSFFVNKYQFPICARCTGLSIGYLLGILLVISQNRFSLFINLALVLIMFIDWFIQYKQIKESNNTRRFFTGVFCGIGGIGVGTFLISIIFLTNS